MRMQIKLNYTTKSSQMSNFFPGHKIRDTKYAIVYVNQQPQCWQHII